MKASRSAQKTLSLFASLNDFFLVVPSSRFIVLGEGKRGLYRGIAVEGFLNQSFKSAGVFSFDALHNGEFEEYDAGYDPLLKVTDFDQLIAAPVHATFSLSKEDLKRIKGSKDQKYRGGRGNSDQLLRWIA